MRCNKTIKPQILKQGATIGIVGPAKPTDEKTLTFCIKQLTDRGYSVKCAKNLTMRYGFFAGEEKIRAESFMEIWTDSEVDAIWCIHGGYGTTPLLDILDFELFNKLPKIFIGMSDITALHIALMQKCHLMTFLGPTLGYLFAPHRIKHLPYSENHLFEVLTSNQTKEYHFPNMRTLKSGMASGRLVGGNLAIISHLMGTPWQLQTEGKILILEDVNEPPYKIDRMLCQLKQGGLLKKPSAVILCTWKGCHSKLPTLTLDEIFQRYFGNVCYPVVLGFPLGHIDKQVTLPLNCQAKLNSDRKTLTVHHSKGTESPFL